MQTETITIGTGMLSGVDAVPITVEATTRSASDGTPRILGLVDAAVREAYHRVLHAFYALSLPQPRGVTTVNFAPAAIRKQGAGFDLPLAIALAGAAGMFGPERTRDLCAFGEVSLRGRLLPARGAISVALGARARGAHTLICSTPDAGLCAGIDGLCVIGAETLADALFFVTGQRDLAPVPATHTVTPPSSLDLIDIRGHTTPKIALAVAAAGGHNLLFVGPPGSGKSALCRRMPGLLPLPSDAEWLAILQVHTAAGLAGMPPRQRPLRAPHHTSSCASLLGGGIDVRPGEATLAHNGVLFLDELPEFRRDALEALRQPLEDGLITVGRVLKTVTMPANFTLVAAMNPCPCGYRGHPARPCQCSPAAIARYRNRISGPLLDRIDLQVEVPALDPLVFTVPRDHSQSTAVFRARIEEARARQERRNKTLGEPGANARLDGRALEAACAPIAKLEPLLQELMHLHRLGGRARVRVLRVARTLADLAERDCVQAEDVLEAAALRGYARQFTP